MFSACLAPCKSKGDYMTDIKFNENTTIWQADKGKIFIHKEKGIDLYGEAIVIVEGQDTYGIEDYQEITKTKFNKLVKERKEMVSNEG